MPIIKKLTPEQMQSLLASPINSPIKLTPQEKFEKLKKKHKGTYLQIRNFHFCAIVTGKNVEVFDGNGNSIAICEFSVSAMRPVRLLCYERFKEAEFISQQGGYKFTVYGGNLEILSDEEIENAIRATKRNLEYNPFKVCSDCKTQFELEEFEKHSCIVGKTWAAF